MYILKDRKDVNIQMFLGFPLGEMIYRFGISMVENVVSFKLEVSVYVYNIFTKLFHSSVHPLVLETKVSPTFSITMFSFHIFISKYYCPVKRARVTTCQRKYNGILIQFLCQKVRRSPKTVGDMLKEHSSQLKRVFTGKFGKFEH